MISNKFGVQNNAKLYIYDSNNNFKTVASTCATNPAYSSYCFNSAVSSNGDYVNIVVHGYKTAFPNDVCIFDYSHIFILLKCYIYIFCRHFGKHTSH